MRKLSVLLLFLALPFVGHAEVKTPTDKIIDTFMALDGDMSDSVSYAEYMTMVRERTQKRFSRMDSNHDGAVSAKEYRRFWNKEQSAYYRLQR
ncbi:MAG: thymidylate synthase [Zetaproteobacteria bacterium]|nr:thymidylate synthase [Zetaproteobacteria bacterium]